MGKISEHTNPVATEKIVGTRSVRLKSWVCGISERVATV